MSSRGDAFTGTPAVPVNVLTAPATKVLKHLVVGASDVGQFHFWLRFGRERFANTLFWWGLRPQGKSTA